MFEAIVSSNGWDDVTVALQLLSHLEGDTLNVALLVPAPRRVLPGGLVDALTEHYSSPGRLADYRRRFERVSRVPGSDPSVFAVELETLETSTSFCRRATTSARSTPGDRAPSGNSSSERRRLAFPSEEWVLLEGVI